MHDDGWLGQFVNGRTWLRVYPQGQSAASVTEPGSGTKPLLYDADGRPLVLDRRAGFIVPRAEA